MTVDILPEDPRWSDLSFDDLAIRATDATLSHVGLDPADWEISILACEDARIADLNAAFRGKPQPTNVLSWPSAERGPSGPGAIPALPEPEVARELGDLAIAYDTCLRESLAAGLPFPDHVTHLLVHGTLHLLGYDHETNEDAARMESLEVEILATLGVPNPY